MPSDGEKEPFLPGLEPPGTIDNLFFACRPSPEAFSRIGRVQNELRRAHGLRGAAMLPQQLHVSLLGVCECRGLPDDLIESACKAAASVAMAPFEVVFDRAMSFSNRRTRHPLVLLTGGGDAVLAGLRNCLSEAMRAAGLHSRSGSGFRDRMSSHFVPHMTLLYDRRMVAEHVIEPVYLTVRDFALVHSLVPQSRHIELARWPLRR